MNANAVNQEMSPEAAQEAAGAMGPGRVLREERERMNLDVLSAANRLNLHRNVIEALEADDFASLPEAIFVRGYLRNYARLLGLDAEAMINRYEEASGVAPLKTTAAQSDRLRGVGEHGSGASGGAGWLVAVVLLLGIAGGGFVWWQQQHGVTALGMPIADTSPPTDPGVAGEADGAPAWNGPAAAETAPEAEEPSPVAVEEEGGSDAGGGGLPPVGEEAAVADASVEAAATAAAEAPLDAPAEEADAPAEPRAAAKPAPPADGRIRLVARFSQDCWSEVVDSEGTKLMFGISKAGTTVTREGVPPIKMLFGRANAVSLEVDGQPFDIAPYTQANIVKVTVGEIDPEADAAAAAEDDR